MLVVSNFSGSSWRDLGRVLGDLREALERLEQVPGCFGGVLRESWGLLRIDGFMVYK